MTRLGPAQWAKMRDEYVTGNETLEAIAERFGANPKTVHQHSCREGNGKTRQKTWGELRSEFLAQVNAKATALTSDTLAERLAEVRDLSAVVAMQALQQLQKRLGARCDTKDADLVNIAKLAAAIKIELSGDPDRPVNLDAKLSALTLEEIRKLANGS